MNIPLTPSTGSEILPSSELVAMAISSCSIPTPGIENVENVMPLAVSTGAPLLRANCENDCAF